MPTVISSGSPSALTRLDRARLIRARILEVTHSHGSWEVIPLGQGSEGGTCRLWRIDTGEGWTASIDTPFSRPASVPSQAELYFTAVHRIEMPSVPDRLIDVYWNGFGKVLSLGETRGQDMLIGFTPGPWEAAFGLPERPWPPAVARRRVRSA